MTPRCCPASRRTASSSASSGSFPTDRAVRGAVDVVVRPELLSISAGNGSDGAGGAAFPRVSSLGRSSATTRWCARAAERAQRAQPERGHHAWDVGDEVRVAVSGPVERHPDRRAPLGDARLDSRLALPAPARASPSSSRSASRLAVGPARVPASSRTTRGRGWSGAARSAHLQLDTLGGPVVEAAPGRGHDAAVAVRRRGADALAGRLARPAACSRWSACTGSASHSPDASAGLVRGRAAASSRPTPTRGSLRLVLEGHSAPVTAALAVWAIDRHLAGRRTAALLLGDRARARPSRGVAVPRACTPCGCGATTATRRWLVADRAARSCRCCGSVATGGGRAVRGTAPSGAQVVANDGNRTLDALHRGRRGRRRAGVVRRRVRGRRRASTTRRHADRAWQRGALGVVRARRRDERGVRLRGAEPILPPARRAGVRARRRRRRQGCGTRSRPVARAAWIIAALVVVSSGCARRVSSGSGGRSTRSRLRERMVSGLDVAVDRAGGRRRGRRRAGASSVDGGRRAPSGAGVEARRAARPTCTGGSTATTAGWSSPAPHAGRPTLLARDRDRPGRRS